MNVKENSNGSRVVVYLSEAEVSDLLQESAQQYEECMRIADLADIVDQGKPKCPRYDWDNPIGLVVAGQANAELSYSDSKVNHHFRL